MEVDLSPVGIIAGWGRYPIVVAQELHDAGVPVITLAIRDHASEELRPLSTSFRWFGVAKLGSHLRYFKKHGVKRVILAGKLFKDRVLFRRFGWLSHFPDWTCIRTFSPHFIRRSVDNRDDSMLMTVVQFYERAGMRVVSGTEVAPDLIAEEGCLTRAKPTRSIELDMDFGWELAKRMGDLDVGQSVTVRDRAVLSVEAIEGTDRCIERTAEVCPRGGFTLVKVAKPHQDMRFDLPTIGMQTIEKMRKAGGKAILIEADRTILLDRKAVLDFADANGITIVARRPRPCLQATA